MNCKRVVSDLKASSERVGRLYPVLVDRHGNIIDGQHRLTADENWPKIKLETVETEEQRLLARLISNVCRRHVPAEEKTEILGRLGEIYLKKGVEPGKIAYKIAEKTGMSYRWVMKYLPEKYKEKPGLGGPKDWEEFDERKVARRATIFLEELLKPPRREGALKVKKYANTHFVSLMLEKSFYEEFEKDSLELGVSTETSALKALEEYHEKIKRALALKNKNKPSEGENRGRSLERSEES